MTTYPQSQRELPALVRHIGGIGLMLGPALQVVGTFFWRDGTQGIAAAPFTVISVAAWLVGLIAVFRALEGRVPRYTAIGLPLAVYGTVGGVAFGVQGMDEELFGVAHGEAVRLLEAYPVAGNLVFWLAGPLFPFSLFALGAVLARIRAVPVPVGLLICLGAVMFPISRIPRDPLVAHVADVLLLLPFLYLGARLMAGGLAPERSDGPSDPADPGVKPGRIRGRWAARALRATAPRS
ncbi:hypothetical protein [Micromonospora craterilacus]|uniref:hypothetical protein n=1 Tax=Micromonospora craterilacus TaxID=1655439 RepID=UPI0018F75141|nr:hypothetical protein [Micromonospora craterilacus]